MILKQIMVVDKIIKLILSSNKNPLLVWLSSFLAESLTTQTKGNNIFYFGFLQLNNKYNYKLPQIATISKWEPKYS